MSNSRHQSQPPQAEVDQIIGLYNQGQLEQTASLAESLAGQYPNALILYDILGAAYMGLQNADKTIESYQKALQLNPNHTDAYNNMGTALYDQGRFDEAVESYQKAVAVEPDFADAHHNLGNALKQTGELTKAIGSYKACLVINPDDAEVLLSYGNALESYGDFHAAIEVYGQVIKISPTSKTVKTNMDNAVEVKAEIDKDIADYARIAKLEIGSAEIASFTGTLLKARGYPDAAIDSYKQAIKIKPDYAEAYSNMGNAQKDKGDLDAAIDSYKQAIKVKPDNAEAYSNMGVALKEKGEEDAAIDSYKQAIKIKPDYAEAHRHLSTVKKYNFADEQITQMKFLYADQKIENYSKCHLCFALAKASEDLGDFQEAFEYLKEGNALRKKALFYDIKKDQTIFANLKKSDLSIPQNTVVSIKKPFDVTPIFILGMPRSGTTLVEQIVSSHSKVTGAGELRFVQQFGLKMAFGTQEINERNLLNFREQYLNSLIQLGEGNLYITDKMPTNFQFIGLICRAFPEAQIIHVTRDAAATCWSNFKHYFSTSGLGYCYDLDDVVRYYQMYEDLMEFWIERYPDRIYNLD